MVEGNIKDYIEKFCSEKSIAFSHCISWDFEDEKAMSAGVATVFKRQLGKPNTADCLNKHLAIQKHDRAIIYSLLTKPTFNSRPSILEYDQSFHHLTEEFKKRGLESLICSPMGCVRDQIPIKHFIKQITEFQKQTKAKVTIVLYDERSRKVLRNGLSHKSFIMELKELLPAATSLHFMNTLKDQILQTP